MGRGCPPGERPEKGLRLSQKIFHFLSFKRLVHSGCYFLEIELNGNWLRPLSGMHALMVSFGDVLISFETEISEK